MTDDLAWTQSNFLSISVIKKCNRSGNSLIVHGIVQNQYFLSKALLNQLTSQDWNLITSIQLYTSTWRIPNFPTTKGRPPLYY